MSQKKKITLAIIVVVLILIAVGVAMTLGSRKAGDSDTEKTADTAKQDKQNALLGETFTDSKAGVTMRIPKDWQLAPKSEKNPDSLTKFQHTKTRSNGELVTRQSKLGMDDIVRDYLEARIDLDINSKLIENKDVMLGKKPARLLIQEIPGPNDDGQMARVVQYIFFRNDTYYILSYITLTTDWEAQRPGIEASAESFEIK